jgi:hypothetical protein
MSDADGLRRREDLYTNLATLERLQSFAEGPGSAPADMAQLTDQGRRYVTTDGGRGAVSTWLALFRPTLDLLRQFRDQDLQGGNADHSDHSDLQQAFEASETALKAVADRINFLAERQGILDGQHSQVG